MKPPFLSIVIPAYNEEHRLPKALEQVFTFLKAQSYSSEVLVIENGSSDQTYQVALNYKHRYPGLKILRATKRGKGSAVKKGMLEAQGEYRFVCDCDLSMPITEANRFFPPQSHKDISIGSREAPGAIRYNEPAYRHTAGRVFNFLIRWLALPGLHDTQCGFKCFRAETAESIFPYQTLEGWAFDVEILFIARRQGFQIEEIPIPWYFNADSRISVIKDSWRMFADLLIIRWNALIGKYGPKA
ncbi:MAG: glycosyltransferase family 2 protein [Anaerolineales bacterium]|nr:glycosyltransferase family 2 protein [Anaerolineales bacterium]